jgi:hypothetical protein
MLSPADAQGLRERDYNWTGLECQMVASDAFRRSEQRNLKVPTEAPPPAAKLRGTMLGRRWRADGRARLDSRLVQPEVDLDVDQHRYWSSVFGSGGKAPVADSFHRLLVEAHTQRSHHPNISGPAVGIHDDRQNCGSLMLRLASLVRVLRFGIVDRTGSADAAADPVDSVPETASLAGADPGTVSTTYPTVCSVANAAAIAWAIRRCQDAGKRVAHWGLWKNQTGRAHHRGLCAELGVGITHHHGRWYPLLRAEAGRIPLRRRELVGISTTATSTGFTGIVP